MLPSLYVEPSEQSCDLSTGRAERATVERRIAAGHLQDTGLSDERRVKTKTNVSSYSFHLALREARLRTRIRTEDTCFA